MAEQRFSGEQLQMIARQVYKRRQLRNVEPIDADTLDSILVQAVDDRATIETFLDFLIELALGNVALRPVIQPVIAAYLLDGETTHYTAEIGTNLAQRFAQHRAHISPVVLADFLPALED